MKLSQRVAERHAEQTGYVLTPELDQSYQEQASAFYYDARDALGTALTNYINGGDLDTELANALLRRAGAVRHGAAQLPHAGREKRRPAAVGKGKGKPLGAGFVEMPENPAWSASPPAAC